MVITTQTYLFWTYANNHYSNILIQKPDQKLVLLLNLCPLGWLAKQNGHEIKNINHSKRREMNRNDDGFQHLPRNMHKYKDITISSNVQSTFHHSTAKRLIFSSDFELYLLDLKMILGWRKTVMGSLTCRSLYIDLVADT